MDIIVMPAWRAGIQVRKDASRDIRVSLDSSTPCWNDPMRGSAGTDPGPIFSKELAKDTKSGLTAKAPFDIARDRLRARSGVHGLTPMAPLHALRRAKPSDLRRPEADFGRRRPKRILLRQGYGGYPLRIHPRAYTRRLSAKEGKEFLIKKFSDLCELGASALNILHRKPGITQKKALDSCPAQA